MRKIVLIGAALIDEAFRYPSEGQIEVEPAEAERLIEAGLARSDELEKMKVDELRQLAAEGSVDLGGASMKAEIIEAIREER